MQSRGYGRLGAKFMLLASLLPFVALSEDIPDDTHGHPATVIEASDAKLAGVNAAAGRESEEPGVSSDALVALSNQADAQVMDSMELGRSEITGNQELPKVLYIVPWQKAEPSDLMGRPVNTLLDEVLAPIDREEFVRAVRYYDDLHGDDDE